MRLVRPASWQISQVNPKTTQTGSSVNSSNSKSSMRRGKTSSTSNGRRRCAASTNLCLTATRMRWAVILAETTRVTFFIRQDTCWAVKCLNRRNRSSPVTILASLRLSHSDTQQHRTISSKEIQSWMRGMLLVSRTAFGRSRTLTWNGKNCNKKWTTAKSCNSLLINSLRLATRNKVKLSLENP